MEYSRNLEQLSEKASLHWTKELKDAARKESLLIDLLDTQDAFISVLRVATKSPESWMKVVSESEALSLALFTKHLMILCDLGGETLNKILPIEKYIPEKALTFDWKGSEVVYPFKAIHKVRSLTNTSLQLTAKTITKNRKASLLKDIVMLLLFGASAKNADLPEEYQQKMIISSLLGNDEVLDKYIQENYIRVSTQIKGADANTLGHFAQNFVASTLETLLPKEWKIKRESSLKGVQHINEVGSETNFDVVAISPSGVQFGIEVSFQVTTNSVIERKARDSTALFERVKANGHHICYVIDGAGNINVRKKAVETICSHSDCTVALTQSEIEVLSKYLKEHG